MQRISFLGIELDSVSWTARLTQERAQSVLNCLKTLSGRMAVSLKLFQRLLGHVAATAVISCAWLLHMKPPQHWLYGRVLRSAWQCGTHRVQITPACRRTFSLWTDPSFLWVGVPLEQVTRHAVLLTDASATSLGATYNRHAVSPSPPLLESEASEWLHIGPAGPGFRELMILATAPPWPIPLRKYLLSQRWGTLWHPCPGRDVEVLGDLPQEVALTIASPWAPSTRRTYALKWNLFIEWCSSHCEDLPLEEADPPLALLCPVCALRQYVDRTQSFRTSEKLFVCYGGQQKGKAVSKQRMAHWIVDAITLTYEAQGAPCLLRLSAHSTRGVASSWVLACGASLADICRAAGWMSPNTFARFYSLRVELVFSCLLTSNG